MWLPPCSCRRASRSASCRRNRRSVDGAALLAKAQGADAQGPGQWVVELAPLTRLQAWAVAEVKPGDTVAMLGFTFAGEKGDAVLRAEYLFVGDKAYGLRSAPA